MVGTEPASPGPKRDRLKDETYISTLLPYTSKPRDSGRLMAPHPLSDLRRQPIPDVDLREVRRLRQQGNFVMANSTSLTCITAAATPAAIEYQSVTNLHNVRRKHMRSQSSPNQRFLPDKVASHVIGWHAEGDTGKYWTRHPEHGISESETTKRYVNFKETNVEACLRLCK